MLTVGGALFAGSVVTPICLKFVLESFEKARQSGCGLSTHESSTGESVLSLAVEGGGSLKRNDSEFSLGLNRTESFDNIVDTLGPLCIFPLCDTGEAIFRAGEIIAKSVLLVLLGKTLFEAVKSGAKIWKK